MPLYLTRFSYTPATWAKLIKNPEDRREAAKQYIEWSAGNCTASGTLSAITMDTICGRPRIMSRWQPRRWRSVQGER